MLDEPRSFFVAMLTVLAFGIASGGACGGDESGSGGAAGSATNASGGGHPGSGGGSPSTGGASPGGGGGSTTANGGGGSATTSSSAGGGSGRTYHTDFPATEKPISENGMWLNGEKDGLDWHDCWTSPHLAIGKQQDTSYTDGTAVLTGAWGPTQTVTAKVHSVNPKDACYQEVEMRLRSAISAHVCSGYEITFKASQSSAAYLIIVRWNGPVGSFDYLLNVSGSQYGVTEGDEVKATIVGNKITAYKNGVEMGSATDDTFADGAPGMGFNLETGDASCFGTNGDYGFTDFTAHAE